MVRRRRLLFLQFLETVITKFLLKVLQANILCCGGSTENLAEGECCQIFPVRQQRRWMHGPRFGNIYQRGQSIQCQSGQITSGGRG
jgi:hypothetical protein